MSPLTPQGLMPSLLDRLIDPDSMGTTGRPGYTVQQMIDAVRSDLEDLLNTHRSDQNLPPELAEVHNSIVGYGLPDMDTLTARAAGQGDDIGRILEDIVARFEPRLRDVRATQARAADAKDRTIHFRIIGRLNADPAPEVGFDTILDLTTGRAAVLRSEG